MPVLVTCKFEDDLIKNECTSVLTSFSPLWIYGSFWLPWKPEFRSNLPQNLMQPYPHPNNATHKIWATLAYWLQRYSVLKMWTKTTKLNLSLQLRGKLKMLILNRPKKCISRASFSRNCFFFFQRNFCISCGVDPDQMLCLIWVYIVCQKSFLGFLASKDHWSHFMIWYFWSSVNSFFKCACTAIQ